MQKNYAKEHYDKFYVKKKNNSANHETESYDVHFHFMEEKESLKPWKLETEDFYTIIATSLMYFQGKK